MGRQGSWGGEAGNARVEQVAAWWRERVNEAVRELTSRADGSSGGFPVGTEPLTDVEQFEMLTEWKLTGDRRYYDDPEAQQRLTELEQEFGTIVRPAAWMPPGMQEQMQAPAEVPDA